MNFLPFDQQNENASIPGLINLISNGRSAMGFGCRDQLIHPELDNRAVALLVQVNPVSGTPRLSIDEDAKSNRSSEACLSIVQLPERAQ
jgi:hypothetical protein